MIQQVLGHRSLKWFYRAENDVCDVSNYRLSTGFPLMTEVLEREHEYDIADHRQAWIHNTAVIKCLPKPNCCVPSFESAPHVWHFKETKTQIEFIIFSDGLRKSHFKGSSICTLNTGNGNHKNDAKLAEAYSCLLKYIIQQYAIGKDK